MNPLRTSGLAYVLTALSLLFLLWAVPAVSDLQVDQAELDKNSSDCISCHDGSKGKHASFCLLSKKGKCSRHIVSITFSDKKVRNEGVLLRKDGTSRKIHSEAVISCATCHGIGAHNGYRDSAKIRTFSLCRYCHQR